MAVPLFRTDPAFYLNNAHSDAIWCSLWTPKTNYLATGSVDSTITIWRQTEKPKSLVPKMQLKGHRMSIISLSCDKNDLCSSSMDCCIRVWNLENDGKLVKSIDIPPIESWSACIDPEGKVVATGSQFGCINVFDIETGKKMISFDLQKKTFVSCVQFSPCGKYIACGCSDGSVHLFDATTGKKKVHQLIPHSTTVRDLKFFYQGTEIPAGSSDQDEMYNDENLKIISVSDDKSIHIYDALTGELKKVIEDAHKSFIFCVGVSPMQASGPNVAKKWFSRFFATGSSDKSVKIWDTETFECLGTFTEHTDAVWSLSFNQNENANPNLLISVGDDACIRAIACPTTTTTTK